MSFAFAITLILSAVQDTPAGSSAPASTPTTATSSVPAAASPAASAAPTKVAASPAKPKLICEEAPVLGSRIIKQKTCLTADEWRRTQLENRRLIDRSQLTPGSRGP